MPDVFKHLLLATEHSEHDSGAETLALALAQHCSLPLAAVMPVLSNPEYEMVAPQLAAQADARTAQRREHLQATAAAQGVALRVRVRRGNELAAEIVAEARDTAADLLIIRRRGQRGLLAKLLVGEMVSKVVAAAPCSVLVSPRSARMWQQRVLVVLDPDLGDSDTLALATALATACGLPLQVLCVAATQAGQGPAQQVVDRALQQTRQQIGHSGAALQVQGDVRVGRVPGEVLDGARGCGADLIVLARRNAAAAGRAGTDGGVQKLIGLAECPVLVHVKAAPPG